MRVVIVSKTFVADTAQRQLEWIARQPGVELTLITPPEWHADDGRVWPFVPHFTEGYAVRRLPVVFNGHFHNYAYRGLASAIDEIKPDLMHIDEEPYNFAGAQAQWLAAKRNIPTIFVALQSIYRRYPPPYSLFEQYDYRHTAHIISVNADVEAVIRRKGYQGQSSIFYVYGIDPELYAPRPRPAQQDETFVAGYLGRLLFDKGLGVLIEALTQLPDNFRVRLVGSGPDHDALADLAATRNVAERVEFAPAVSSTEIPDALAQMDVLVLPSLTRHNWKEQFGRVLIEAMACDVPVLGSNSGEIPNVIGDAGLIVPEGDAGALAQGLRTLQEQSKLRTDYVRRGRERVLGQFTQEQVARRTAALYRQVVSGGNADVRARGEALADTHPAG
jgi:glycosyltransferase involved in cell wall biosynthesis